MDNLKKNIILTPFNILYKFSPKKTLELLFRLKMGQKLHLKNPVTYNEKLQWIKLYDKNPLMPICCDKYAVREYIEKKGYGHLLNELIWEGFDPEEIPFDRLPERFVIKVTHGSTFNIICTERDGLDREKTKRLCRKWLKEHFLPCYGEWFYGVVRPRIIIEKYLEGDQGKALFDYKIFCFNGKAKMVYVDTWKNGHHAINAYDRDLKRIPDVQLGYPNDNTTRVAVPPVWEEMVRIAEDLSKDFLHVRVDLYYTDNKIVFGELTFTKGAGFGKIKPASFDRQMGSWLELPIPKKKIVFAASSGGHLEQLLMLKLLMDKYDSVLLTEKTPYLKDLNMNARVYTVPQVNRKEPAVAIKLLTILFRSLRIFLKEKPDAVICTGVLAMIPMCLLAKLFGKKLIFIESFAKMDSPTLTGKLLYRFADRFYVQWESMKEFYPKAICLGGIY